MIPQSSLPTRVKFHLQVWRLAHTGGDDAHGRKRKQLVKAVVQHRLDKIKAVLNPRPAIMPQVGGRGKVR